jgi:hypothetical protein
VCIISLTLCAGACDTHQPVGTRILLCHVVPAVHPLAHSHALCVRRAITRRCHSGISCKSATTSATRCVRCCVVCRRVCVHACVDKRHVRATSYTAHIPLVFCAQPRPRSERAARVRAGARALAQSQGTGCCGREAGRLRDAECVCVGVAHEGDDRDGAATRARAERCA